MGETNKGAWTAVAWDREGLTVSAYGRGIIARCPVPQDGGTMDCVANARLIAAAPELYDALAFLMTAVDYARVLPGPKGAEIKARALAALATARGSS